MNCKQAEEAYTILDFLSAKKIHIPSAKAGGYMLKSPFRDERTASFHVDITGRKWMDHGDGDSKGGGLVKLVQRWYNVGVSDALKIITEVMGAPGASITTPPPITVSKPKPAGVEVRIIQRLTDIKLLEYAEGRGIPKAIAVKYLWECYYSINGGGNFHALAFSNDKGGYELRNIKYQYNSTPKGITTLKGIDSSKVAIFEGFFDFLSALVYYDTSALESDVIVLNSISQVDSALAAIKKYRYVNLFLDNDPAGAGGVRKIISKCKGAVNWSERLYPTHKDFNEFLTKSLNERVKVT